MTPEFQSYLGTLAGELIKEFPALKDKRSLILTVLKQVTPPPPEEKLVYVFANDQLVYCAANILVGNYEVNDENLAESVKLARKLILLCYEEGRVEAGEIR